MHIGLGLTINSAKIKKLASAITFFLRLDGLGMDVLLLETGDNLILEGN